jgi:hypothetical protein
MSKAMVTKSEEWKALLPEEDRSRRNVLYDSLLQQLKVSDVDTLASTLESPHPAETMAALGLLLVTLRKRKELIEDSSKSEIAARLRPLLNQYPGPVGLNAFHLLKVLDPEKAENFLLNVHTDRLLQTELLTFISNLVLFPSSRAAIGKLSQLSHLPGESGETAKRQLENLGIMASDEISRIAEDWRKNKTKDSLNRLYYGHISFQGGQPIDSILTLLGTPSRQDGRDYFYDSSDGVTLRLEVNSERRLKAMKIK